PTQCNPAPYFGETWAWDGVHSTWTQLTTVGSPGARFGHRLAYDPNLGSSSGLYLFGGQTGNGLVQDTWYLPNTQGATWSACPTSLCSGSPPAARCCYGFAYDGRKGG